MKTTMIGLFIATGLLFTGCAMTPSKPLTFNQLGQFNSIPLNTNLYRISFQTNSNMSYGSAQEITLVKAAQTTVQNGFKFFKVLNDPSNTIQHPPRQTVVYPPPPPMYYPPSYYGHGHPPGFWPAPYPYYATPQVVNVEPTQVSYTIECFKDQKSAPSDAFNATLILKSIGSKYGVSETGEILPPPTPVSKK